MNDYKFKIGDLVHCGDQRVGVIVEGKKINANDSSIYTVYKVYFSDDLRTWWCSEWQIIKI